MKKLFLVLAVVSVSMVACKKDYTCTVGGVSVTYTGLDKDEANALESACTAAGGTWEKK
jgi:hypothetical protein